MKIIADQQIAYVREAFSGFGEILLCDGRNIDRAVLTDADVLLVRSVTNVNSKLLDRSQVKFVGTATSGVDHVDLDYLADRNIAFASAHGCNALSVVEYVLSSLFVLAEQYAFNPFCKTVGIIGCGKIGSRLRSTLGVLGMKCIVNDPPLQEKMGNNHFSDLEEILATDIISLHVPLTDTGKYPTRHMVNWNFLKDIRSDAMLINTSRGGVIQENALLEYLDNNDGFRVVLDVWNHEPEINPELLERAAIGTPHIAGYSMDAKIRATEMLITEFCNHFKLQSSWQPAEHIRNLGRQHVRIGPDMTDEDAIQLAVLSHFDVRSDAAALRRLLEFDQDKTGYYFDELRKNYPVRREFSATTINLSETGIPLAGTLQKLGFDVELTDQ